jgi:hypothetical protein
MGGARSEPRNPRRYHARDLPPRRGVLRVPVRAGGPYRAWGAVWSFGISLFVFGIIAVVLFARLLWETA